MTSAGAKNATEGSSETLMSGCGALQDRDIFDDDVLISSARVCQLRSMDVVRGAGAFLADQRLTPATFGLLSLFLAFSHSLGSLMERCQKQTRLAGGLAETSVFHDDHRSPGNLAEIRKYYRFVQRPGAGKITAGPLWPAYLWGFVNEQLGKPTVYSDSALPICHGLVSGQLDSPSV